MPLNRIVFFSALALSLGLGVGSAQALNELVFVAPSEARPGDQVDLAIQMDFDDTTIGGSFQIQFDADVFDFIDIVYTISTDPAFTCPGRDTCPAPPPDFLSYGDFAGYEPGGRSVGTASLRVKDTALFGDTQVALSQAGNGFADDIGSPLEVAYGMTVVNIVPEPATLALLGVGLSLLGSRRGTR